MAASNQVRSPRRRFLSHYLTTMSNVWIFYSVCLILVMSAGCGLMANAIYIVKGTDAPAEFDELKDNFAAAEN